MADLGTIGVSYDEASFVAGGAVSGQVRDASGDPVPEALVSYLDRTAGDLPPVWACTRTDATGNYAFPGMGSNFSAGPRLYAAVVFTAAADKNGLVLDKLEPV